MLVPINLLACLAVMLLFMRFMNTVQQHIRAVRT